MPAVNRANNGQKPVAYLGIDPGASGGMAVIRNGTASVTSLSGTDRQTWEWVKYQAEWLTAGAIGDDLGLVPSFAILESNTGYVGGEGNPGSAMFKFGKSHGLLEMALIAAGIPYELITPAKWQKALGIVPRKKGKGAESKTQFKNRLKQFAERLYPNVKVTLATADALLIATYCQRKREGTL